MPTYVYETVGRSKRTFEVRQSMNDKALTKHPQTGEPVRRVISGGFGLMGVGKSVKAAAAPAPRMGGHGCCGGSCGCH